MHVLVCDDDPDVGTFMTTLFDLEGWTPTLVTSGAECLEMVRAAETPVDALVLDQVMPGLTGCETAHHLREEGFTVPIILCSGHLGPELTDDIERLGLIPCNKIDFEALVRVVRASMRDARLARRRKAEYRT